MTEIPFVNLEAEFHEIENSVRAAIDGVLLAQRFISGTHVASFESNFARTVQGGHAVAVSSGTAALSLALEAAGIRAGDEVLVPAMTFAATAEAVVHVGGIPRFVDCGRRTGTIDVELAERSISPRTRAVIAVHLYGSPCDMRGLADFAQEHNLLVVEDCAQAHIAEVSEQVVGSFGAAATYSFYPSKNLGAYGDAGAVTSFDTELIRRVRMLSNHGRDTKHTHSVVGYNHRMDEMQAAILEVKLQRLRGWTTRRQEIALRYAAGLRGTRADTLSIAKGATPVYHIFPIFLEGRDLLRQRLSECGIETGLHYPIPLHRQPAFRRFDDGRGDLTQSEELADHEISLPIYPQMSDDQADRIIDCILAAL